MRFCPLSLRPPTLAAAAAVPGAPHGWGFLDTMAYIADLTNETTAKSSTSAGYPIQVTFVVAASPRLSYFCAHCTTGDGEPALASEPVIIHTAEHLVLLCVIPLAINPHYSIRGSPEYFIYKAAAPAGGGGGARPPSLEPLPQLHPYRLQMKLPECSVGIVPDCGGSDGEHFLLAAVGFDNTLRRYQLHVFNSEEDQWTKKPVAVDAAGISGEDEYNYIIVDKVIRIAGGVLGWVGLWRGILVCDVLAEVRAKAKAKFIPLPSLLAANKDKFLAVPAQQIRDITCTNGMIKLVEYERLTELIMPGMKPFPDDDSDRDVLLDSELILGPASVKERKEDPYVYCGWRLIAWNKMVSSDHWCKLSLVHSHDFGAVMVLPLLGDGDGAPTEEKMHPADIISANCPVWGMGGGNDDVYLFVKSVGMMGDMTYVLPIDMGNKKLGELKPFSVRNMCYIGSCIPSELPTYLKTDSGLAISDHSCGSAVQKKFFPLESDDEKQPRDYKRSRKA